MQKIIQLPQQLINKIAAGEVIERPASVVKELVENAIDAKASKIQVEITDGGIKQITVTDNGAGMAHSDAIESYKMHTTSKLSTIEDLDKILTFGFRGEALASIAAVSELIIHTKNENEVGTQLIIENSSLQNTTTAPRSQGTTITVRE